MGWFILGLVIGLVIGTAVTLIMSIMRSRMADKQLRETFAALAAEALDANAQRLSTQAGTAFDGKKQLIDQSVKAINERLEQVRQFIQRIETERKADLGRLSTSVTSLAGTTGELHRMLASTQRRGAWGERMAEDILRLAGLQDGVNYVKQSGEQAASGRPDFTFFLPNDLKVNMDVKFPLEHYKAYTDAENDDARAAAMKQLVSAVNGHVRAVAGRGYIDTKGDVPTVPYVIVFVPSEQIFSLVLQADVDLIDKALGQKVVLASPLTLYAMLCVIRQAAENANLMKTADEIVSLLSQFDKQYQSFREAEDKVAQRFRQASDEFDKLVTTRRNMLQRPLDKIEELRLSRGLSEE